MDTVINMLLPLAPWVQGVFTILGAAVVVGMAVDKAIPDEKDKGFMGKILAFPVIGPFLAALSKFSPFNFKDKE